MNLQGFNFKAGGRSAPAAGRGGTRLWTPPRTTISGAEPERCGAPLRAGKDTRNFEFSFIDANGQRVQAEVNNGRVTSKRSNRLLFSLAESDVHYPEEATNNYLAGYKPFDFMADEMSRVVMVDHDQDMRRDFSSNMAFQRVRVKGSAEGAIPEVDPSSSLTAYKTVDRILGCFVSTVAEDNAKENYRVRQVAAQMIGDKLALDREIDVLDPTVGVLGNSANWTANNVTTLGSTTYWDTGSASDPLGDIERIIGTASYQPVTEIWMPYNVMLVFIRHPQVGDRLRAAYGDSAVSDFRKMTPGGPQPIEFTIPGYPIFRSVQSRVLNETTGGIDYILNNEVLLLRSLGGSVPLDGRQAATSYTFRVRGNTGVGYETREFRIEGRGQKGGVMVVAYMSDIAQMTGSNIGGMIKTVLSP